MRLNLFLIRLEKLGQIIRAPRLLQAWAFNRVLAGAEHRRILTNDLETVVDIGANRGQFALIVRQWAPKARVIAFEPLREPRMIFERVFGKDELITLHPYAIGPGRTDALIHVTIDDDSSSLLPIGKAQTRLFPRTREKEVRKVTVVPLWDVLDPQAILEPALLKIDVQGYELEVLRGCEPLLNRFRYIYVECSFIELYDGQALAWEVIAFLAKYRFQLAGVYNMYYDRQGRAIQGDFLFSMRD